MSKKNQTKRTSPDELAKTTKKADIELTEEELGKASGGSGSSKLQLHCCTGTHIKTATL
jgi:hypothetical protein